MVDADLNRQSSVVTKRSKITVIILYGFEYITFEDRVYIPVRLGPGIVFFSRLPWGLRVSRRGTWGSAGVSPGRVRSSPVRSPPWPPFWTWRNPLDFLPRAARSITRG